MPFRTKPFPAEAKWVSEMGSFPKRARVLHMIPEHGSRVLRESCATRESVSETNPFRKPVSENPFRIKNNVCVKNVSAEEGEVRS